jgi:N-acetyl sugar amidotransferase
MKFCKNCVLPTTRPQVKIEHEGICNACVGALEKKNKIDWSGREQELRDLLKTHRSTDGSNYDCLIPVSGGKDSTWQVHTLINTYKLKPLAITWKPMNRTDIGKRNLNNLINLGVDHIDFTVNPKVEKRFMLRSFEKNGSPSLSEHMAMYAITLRTAINYGIHIVIWGENPGLEYGGATSDRGNPFMKRDWIRKYGVSNSTFAEDWIDENLTRQDMLPYTFPTDEEIEQARILPIFLGWYLPWDPLKVATYARKVGFEWGQRPQVGCYRFADLDAPFVVIHHLLKWHKFGFTRLWDNLSIEIRNGRLTHDEAIEYIRLNPERIPYDQIYQLCRYLEISEMHFWKIVETHRNLEIWEKDTNGKWYIPAMVNEFGFFPDNYLN